MKSWVELTFWPHIAYAYKEDGKVSKLLEGKSAKVFATCGGPAWIYKTFLFPLKPFWKASVFEFCGADLVDIRICGNLDKWKDDRRDKLFDKFLKAIKKIK
jgi:putative NADPH-quinone reductase